MEKTTPFQITVDARILYERLIKVPPGGFVSYKELSELIKRDVQKNVRYLLETARRKSLNENQIVFGTIKNKGLKRLEDIEKVSIGENVIEHVRRASKAGIKKIMCVENFDKLPNPEKIKHNTHLSMLGVFNGLTQRKNIKHLESKIEQAQNKLSLIRTLEMFTKNEQKGGRDELNDGETKSY